ncbi:MAG: riboflavin synthase [Proteobacteria bacterium]|nr:riboflavin synthase [Pseudomonadota bacterium]
MFTGLIEEVGVVKETLQIGDNQVKLIISCNLVSDEVKIGDSIAVDGVCLTVVAHSNNEIQLEVSGETHHVTLIGSKRRGTKVNLERALKLSDRMGGHIVQGHVDSISQLLSIKEMGGFFEMTFTLESSIKKYCVHKGSITVNGISLTVAELKDSSFSVALIPHTFKSTNFVDLKESDRVHIETDVIARYIERLLPFQNQESESRLTVDFLKKHGF